MTKRSTAPAWLEASGKAHLLSSRLQFEQLRNLYAVTRYAYRTSIIFAVLVFLNFFLRVPNMWLLPWFFTASGIAIARYVLARRFEQAQPPESGHRRWAGAAIGLIALQALSWIAVLAMADFTQQPMDVAFAVFLVCTLIFGGLTLFGFYLPAYLVFAMPLFGAFWIWLLLLGAGGSLWLSVTVAFGALAVLDSARNSSRLIRQTLELDLEREELARRLDEEKELATTTLRSIGDGVLTAGVDGLLTSLNPVAEKLTGWQEHEARGRPLQEVLQLVDETTGVAPPDLVRLCRSGAGRVVLEQQALVSSRSGEREAVVELSVSPIHDPDKAFNGIVVVLRDVTELRGMARAVSYQASHDPLTGLFNRPAFEAKLRQTLEDARLEQRQHALCHLNLDQFKLVNDTCGHKAGDALLQQVARLLSQQVREVDTVARLTGDEFGLLLHDCDPPTARRVAENVSAALNDFRFHWDGKTFKLSVSIGLVPLDADSTPAVVLAAAESACSIAKERGRGYVHNVHPRDHELAARHGEVQWTQRIQNALDQDLFRLRFQRIVPLDDAGEEMAEILLSLNDPSGSSVAPGRFLPAAERFNMMPSIDRRVVSMVFEKIRRGGLNIDPISRFNINLSGQSLNDERFLSYVLRQLAESGVDPRRIGFEITETAVIANLSQARRFIDALHQTGCSFALDDFGSGLSSFAYLRTLPVDYLKIDGLFVKHMSSDAIDHSMVEAINQVGHIMGIRTIAEFVEDEATLAALRRLGVDYAQGHAVHWPEWL